MENGFGHFDLVRFEFFERLLPRLLYGDDEEICDGLLDALGKNGRDFIFSTLLQMCADDGADCPYGSGDFDVKIFGYGNISFIQMNLPPCNPSAGGIVRAYILCSGDSDMLYFIIKRFKEGEVFILYVTPELQVLKSDELTAHTGDMNYEYQALSEIYQMVMQEEQSDAVQGYWSRDWLKVDWHSVRDKMKKGEQDIGISEEEYLELMCWCVENKPEIYRQMVFYLALREHDIPDGSAMYIAAHPDQFREALDCFKK